MQYTPLISDKIRTQNKHTNNILTYITLSLSLLNITSVQVQAQPIQDKTYHFTILHTNDHHGRFWKNSDGEYGLSAQKTLIDQIRSEVKSSGGTLLLLSGGDINTGVPESDMQDAEPDFKAMDKIGFDAMVLGNHEFDKPLEILAMQQQWVNFPMISANVYRGGNPMFESHKIFDKEGLRIAVLGLTTNDTQKMVNPENLIYNAKWISGNVINTENTAGIEFLDPIKIAAQLVPKLRQEADVVIAATHMGHYPNGQHGSSASGDVEMARAVDGIDLIVGGHSQNPVCMKAENIRDDAYVPGGECKPDQQNGTWIVQAHEWGKYVGRADFEYKNGKINLVKYTLIPINLKRTVTDAAGQKSKVFYTSEIMENPEMLALLTPYQEKGQQILSVEIGSSNGLLDGDRANVRNHPTNLAILIARAMKEKLSADFSVLNSGGVRDSIAAGKITYKDVLTVQPFGSTLVYVELTGQEVQDYLNTVLGISAGSGGFAQFDGLKATHENGAAHDIMINDQALDLKKIYRVAMNDFVAAGGDGYPKMKGVNPTYIDTGYVDADVLKAYLQKNTPVDVTHYAPKNEIIRLIKESGK